MKKTILILLLCPFLHTLCFGQATESQSAPLPGDSVKGGTIKESPTKGDSIKIARPDIPRIESIEVFHSDSAQLSNSEQINKDPQRVAYAGNIIRFVISNPRAFLRSKPSDQAKVVLYVNGIEMTGITADWYSQVTTLRIQGNKLPDLTDTTSINIQLVRNAGSQNSWMYLYSNTEYFTRTYFDVRDLSLGWEHMSPLDKGLTNTSLTIAFYHFWEFIAWSLLYIITLLLFICLAYKTNLLRSSNSGPYSLSNSQLLFWTSLVMGAFIYTLLLTDIGLSFNSSILLLLGISMGTTGAAIAIDQNKINSNKAVPKQNQKFLKDLLTDGDSYSMQRVQSFAWNMILGLYFVIYTVKNKTMPEFSSTMLLLAGFSSTSYLTGKLSENTLATTIAQKAQADLKMQADQKILADQKAQDDLKAQADLTKQTDGGH